MKTKRLNILFITHWYPTKAHLYGGVFVREYAKAVQANHNVVVLHLGVVDPKTQRWWCTQEESDENLTDGVPSYRAAYRAVPIRGCSWPLYWVSVMRAVTAMSKIHGPFHLVHAHVFNTGLAALLIGRWYRIPVVISEHASAYARGGLSWFEVRQARQVFRRADAVLPVSHALQSAMRQHGINAQFQVMPNTINTNLFRFEHYSPAPDGTIRILSVSSFVPYKGLAILLRALSQVAWRGRPWRLEAVGGQPGPSQDQHQQMVEELGLASHVTFHGMLQKHDVARLMRAVDFFVLPSLVETFSVATAEALASGLPVLVTRCGGPEGFVEEQCGLLVPPADATALAEGLTKMLDHLATYNRARIARSARERFGYQSIAAELDEVYSRVLGAN